MDKFTGKCVGGPYDGKMFAHWTNTIKFYRPVIASIMNAEDAPIIPVNVGEYHLNDFGQWHWWPTEEGRAYDTLFDKQTTI